MSCSCLLRHYLLLCRAVPCPNGLLPPTSWLHQPRPLLHEVVKARRKLRVAAAVVLPTLLPGAGYIHAGRPRTGLGCR